MAMTGPKPSGEGEGGREFRGTVVRNPVDALAATTGVSGPHQVWFPADTADVAAAVAGTRGLMTFVRSGMRAEAGDTIDAAGGAVINLAALKGVSVTKDFVHAEAAATAKSIARHLAASGLALPLTDNPQQSIASGVLHGGPSCLMRTLGPLSDYVSALEVVSPAGEPKTLSGRSAVGDARAGNAVVTGIVFERRAAEGLWMVRKSFPYPGKERFAAVVEALFSREPAQPVPPGCDLVLDAYSVHYDVSVVRVTAAGSSAEHKSVVGALVDRALAPFPKGFAGTVVPEEFTDAGVVQAVADSGPGIPLDPEVETRRVHEVVSRVAGAGLDEFLRRVAEVVDRGLAFRDDQTGAVDPEFRQFTRLQLNGADQLERSGFIYTPRAASPSGPDRVALGFRPDTTPPPPERPGTLTRAARAGTPLHPGPAAPARATIIPDFRGNVVVPGDKNFAASATQYASSSYLPAKMTPLMVAYPLDVADIQAAIRYAEKNEKRIVARSGGHQYSGLSSGDDSAIVLAMDAFNDFRTVADNVVEVGPAIRLTELAAKFKAKRITIPHGECPLVGIGGHAQTGGYGHLLRGFGLATDHVTAFTIVLADGTVRTVHRPKGAPKSSWGKALSWLRRWSIVRGVRGPAPAPNTPFPTDPPTDDLLFWGVLGGNAGSFGVVTNYRLECIRDVDHPHSYGYSEVREYNGVRYRALMEQVQAWTRRVGDQAFMPGMDFTMTVKSKSKLVLKDVLNLELVHSNVGGAGEVIDGDRAFASVIQASQAGQVAQPGVSPWGKLERGAKPLSALSESFVRRAPQTTPDGREFEYPYNKRINCTTDALTDEFVEGFITLIEDTLKTEDVYLVFQMMIGGGACRSSEKRHATALPRRDFVFCFMFDLFYDKGRADLAAALQDRMKTLIDKHYSAAQEQRLFWSSFGDTDMNTPQVRDYYYDDLKAYEELRKLKKRVDPNDVFRTPLTVKLP